MRRAYRMPVSNVAYSNVVTQTQCYSVELTEQKDGTEEPKNYVGLRTVTGGVPDANTIVYGPGEVIKLLPPATKDGFFKAGVVIAQVITISGAKNQFPAASNLDQREF